MNKITKIITIIIIVIALVGCQAKPVEPAVAETTQPQVQVKQNKNLKSIQIMAMDTVMDISAAGVEDAVFADVAARVRQLESLLSTTDKGSEIYRLNRDSVGALSEDTETLLSRALQLCRETDGALDISIYPIVKLWGFTTGQYRVPQQTEIDDLLDAVDYSKVELADALVTLQPGMQIDLGSIAKGYTGDQIISILKSAGAKSALLNLGGNVQTIGSKPDGKKWRIGVKDPIQKDVLGIVQVDDKVVISSGSYERYFEDENGQTYGHIIDPATGRPADSGLISVTIVADEGIYSDALSTSLYIMGLNSAIDFWRKAQDFEAVFVTEDQVVYITPGLKDSYSFAKKYRGRELVVIEK